jgi:hypothetical protein
MLVQLCTTLEQISFKVLELLHLKLELIQLPDLVVPLLRILSTSSVEQ